MTKPPTKKELLAKILAVEASLKAFAADTDAFLADTSQYAVQFATSYAMECALSDALRLAKDLHTVHQMLD